MNIQTGHLTEHLTDAQWATALSEGAPNGGPVNASDEAIGQHLRDCAQCRAEREQLQQLMGRMRHQVTAPADRPAAFWNRQLQATLQRIHSRTLRPRTVRAGLAPALAGMLALVAVALLLLQSPATTAAPGSHLRAIAATPLVAGPAPSAHVGSMQAHSAPAGATAASPSAASIPATSAASVPDDAALMAEIERTMQATPAALQPAALLAQELLSAPITETPAADSTGSTTGSKGELQ